MNVAQRTSIHARIREICDSTDITDPAEIAKIVADELPEHELREILSRTLVSEVRVIFHNRRAAYRQGSEKWDQAKDAYAIFHQRVCVDQENREWKLLGECSASDIENLIAIYTQRAAENLAVADGYGRLATQMKKKKAKTVNELTPQVVEEALRG